MGYPPIPLSFLGRIIFCFRKIPSKNSYFCPFLTPLAEKIRQVVFDGLLLNEKKLKSSKSNVIFVMKVLMDPGPPPDYDTAVVIKRNNFFPNVQR